MSIKILQLNNLATVFSSGSLVQRTFVASNLLLLLACSLLLVMIATVFTADDMQAEPIPSPAKGKSAILLGAWFRGSQPIQQTNIGELETSTLKAKLSGVVIGKDISSVTIAFNGKPERLYHIGDKLSSSVTIEQIEPYRIIVKQNGKNMQILMQKPDGIIDEEQSLGNSDEQGTEGGFSMANMFGAIPVRVDNYGSGFKLNKLSAEMKMLADIEDNDIVVDVGGVGVQELMSDPQQWMKYSTQSSLPVTVIRDGQEVVVNVNAASLSAKMLPKFGLNK